MTIRSRFAIITGALALVLAIVVSLSGFLIATNQLQNQLDRSLNVRASRILSVVGQQGFSWNDAFGPGPVNQAIEQTEVDAITQVTLSDGTFIGRRGYPQIQVDNSDKALLAKHKNGYRRSTTNIGGHEFRVLTIALADGTLIKLAKDTNILVQARQGMKLWFPIITAILVVIASLFGWLFARRVSKPIEELAATAEGIAATQDLSQQIEAQGDAEVRKLTSSFNTMLAALRVSVARQSQLVQDASHELRTPLTSLRANTELLQRPTLPEADRISILQDMRAEIDELTALSAELSALATDQRTTESPESIDLIEVAEEIAARAQRRTSASVTVHSTDDTIVTARHQQLERALSNLVDNALKFSDNKSDVEIHVGDKRVEVRDHGPGIPDDDKPHVFDRFYRATSSRSVAGSGLGLSIVSQFAADHNASAYVLDNVNGGAIVGIQFKD